MTDLAEKKEGAARPIPEPTLRRLPIYHHYLTRLKNERQLESISCTTIGNDLNILPIQVRKDLEITDAVGKPKLGYSVTELIDVIEDFLGWKNTTEAFLVGVGNLGSALLGYNGFINYGLDIVAGFDADETKADSEIQGKRIFHVSKLPDMIRRMNILIGILTVPGNCAQELADVMVKAGIGAIWNFSPVKLSVPPYVIVQHEHLASSLVVLSKKLAIAMKKNKD
jgi:redox-sensing transcriptional repressor